MKTILVLSERGRLLGTFEPPKSSAKAGAALLPAKGQKLQEHEVEDALLAPDREDELLRLLRRRFRLK
jgi:hypothetical protein